jgi:hypothetical protein
MAVPHRQPGREILKALRIDAANLRFLDSAVEKVEAGYSEDFIPSPGLLGRSEPTARDKPHKWTSKGPAPCERPIALTQL